MFQDKKVAFIGPGIMAEAMISGLIHRQVAPSGSVLAAGPRQERLEELEQNYAISTTLDNAEAARQADLVVLAVKPQFLNKVMAGLNGSIRPDALVLSIVAGATIAKISAGLNHRLVVRSMPNTPAQIGEGITVWTGLTGGVGRTARDGPPGAGLAGPGGVHGGRELPGYGHCTIGDRPGLRVSVYGSDGRRWSASGLPAPYRQAVGRPNGAWLGALLFEPQQGRPCSPGSLAKRCDLTGWDFGRSIVLPGEGRFPHRFLAGHLGCL